MSKIPYEPLPQFDPGEGVFGIAVGYNELQRQELKRRFGSGQAEIPNGVAYRPVGSAQPYYRGSQLPAGPPISPASRFMSPVSGGATIPLPTTPALSSETIDWLNSELEPITPARPLPMTDNALESLTTGIWQRINDVKRQQQQPQGTTNASTTPIVPAESAPVIAAGVPPYLATDTDLSEINDPAVTPTNTLTNRLIRNWPSTPGWNPNLELPSSSPPTTTTGPTNPLPPPAHIPPPHFTPDIPTITYIPPSSTTTTNNADIKILPSIPALATDQSSSYFIEPLNVPVPMNIESNLNLALIFLAGVGTAMILMGFPFLVL